MPQLRHGTRTTALDFLPDGRLVSASSNDALRIWDGRTGLLVGRLPLTPAPYRSTRDVRLPQVLKDGTIMDG